MQLGGIKERVIVIVRSGQSLTLSVSDILSISTASDCGWKARAELEVR